jgi:hypothetical protein
MLWNMDKWFKDILPDKDPYHNRGRDQMRKKGGPEFECLWSRTPRRYCHFITLVTNVFLTTVGTATPPGGGDGWMVSIAIFWIEMTNVRLPIYDGQIRVIYVDYLLLSCMPVYTGMLLYVCYMIWFRHFIINDIFISNLCLSLAHQTEHMLCWQKILWWQQLVYLGPPPLSSQNLEDRNFKSRAC